MQCLGEGGSLDDLETWELGNFVTLQRCYLGTWEHCNLVTWNLGNLITWCFVNLVAW